MRQLSDSGRQLINEIAQRHGFSPDGVQSMLFSVINGNGYMAQFNHPDFSGSGQWMQGGMTMVSDMFNNYLKGRVDSLCQELSNLIINEPGLMQTGSFQSQSQGGGYQSQGGNSQSQSNGGGYSSSQQMVNGMPVGPVSLFVPPTRENTGQWWPENLGQPASTGSQNDMRYAYFPYAHRLAVNISGKVSVYDTMDHQIGGFSQQQSGGSSVSFTSQYGLVNLLSLPIISGESVSVNSNSTPSNSPQQYQAPQSNQGYSSNNNSNGSYQAEAPTMNAAVTSAPKSNSMDSQDVFAAIEKLAGLLEKGYLSPEEFAEKKRDLLSRI
jgi:hypothetical protein